MRAAGVFTPAGAVVDLTIIVFIDLLSVMVLDFLPGMACRTDRTAVMRVGTGSSRQ